MVKIGFLLHSMKYYTRAAATVVPLRKITSLQGESQVGPNSIWFLVWSNFNYVTIHTNTNNIWYFINFNKNRKKCWKKKERKEKFMGHFARFSIQIHEKCINIITPLITLKENKNPQDWYSLRIFGTNVYWIFAR